MASVVIWGVAMPYRAVDAHIHVIDPKLMHPDTSKTMLGFGGVGVEQYARIIKEPDVLLKLMDEAGVDASVVVSYYAPEVMGFGYNSTEFVADYVRRSRGRLYALGGINPWDDKLVERLEWLFSKLEVVGLKIHPVHQLFKPNAYKSEEGGLKSLEKVYEFLEDNQIPLVVHTGTSVFPRARVKFGDPLFLDDVAVDFPRLRIVMCHGGRPFWTDRAFFLLKRHSNLFLDISGIPLKRLNQYFPRFEEIAQKTIFGSDWPGISHSRIASYISIIKEMGLSQEAVELILSGNAERVYGLSP